MMDRVIPGGMERDLAPGGVEHLAALIAIARKRFPELVDLYEDTASLKDRTVSTGILSPALARQYAPAGYLGRAPAPDFDPRGTPAYRPNALLRMQDPERQPSDATARAGNAVHQR